MTGPVNISSGNCGIWKERHWSRKDVWGVGVPERTCCEVTVAPHAFPGAEWGARVGKEVESEGMNKNLQDREERHFIYYLWFLLLPNSFIWHKIYFPHVHFAFTLTVINKLSLWSYLAPQAFSSYFLLLCCWRVRMDDWMGVWYLIWINPARSCTKFHVRKQEAK